MPTGDWRTVNFFLRNIAPFTRVKLAAQYPLRALDIGVGAGRWGFLFRDCMEFRADRYFKKDWVYTVDGVEVFEGYRNPVWSYAYDQIVIADIRNVISEIENRKPYDFIFFMDVIEHLPKEEGEQILARLVKRTRNRLILTFPDGNQPESALRQGAVHQNENERHISLWTQDDLKPYQIVDSEGPCLYALKGGV